MADGTCALVLAGDDKDPGWGDALARGCQSSAATTCHLPTSFGA